MEISDPAQAPPSRSGSSALAVLIALSASLLLGFFACSVVAISKRWSRGPEHSTAFEPAVAAAAPEPPQALGAPTGRTATVVLRPPYTVGVMHTDPAMNAALVKYIPAGTVVEVGTSRTVPGRTSPDTWFQTRAVVGGIAYAGWMHKDILRME